jgi:DNA-binding CsgD family transcriptional regulator
MAQSESDGKANTLDLSGKMTIDETNTSPPVAFTKKELEVLALVCRQKTSKEISQILGISPRTVEGYREKMREKAGAKNQIGLILYAIRHGLFIME